MKSFVFLPFALIALFSVNAKASIDSNIKKICIPIKKEMCKAGDCSKINQVVEIAFLNCIASHTELKLINKNTDLSKVEPKTKAGFNLVFGHMLGKIGADIKSGNPNANYVKLKSEYANIKFKYDTYHEKDGDQLVDLAKI